MPLKIDPALINELFISLLFFLFIFSIEIRFDRNKSNRQPKMEWMKNGMNEWRNDLPGHEVRELTGNGLVPAKQDRAMTSLSSPRMKRLINKNNTGAYSLEKVNFWGARLRVDDNHFLFDTLWHDGFHSLFQTRFDYDFGWLLFKVSQVALHSISRCFFLSLSTRWSRARRGKKKKKGAF